MTPDPARPVKRCGAASFGEIEDDVVGNAVAHTVINRLGDPLAGVRRKKRQRTAAVHDVVHREQKLALAHSARIFGVAEVERLRPPGRVDEVPGFAPPQPRSPQDRNHAQVVAGELNEGVRHSEIEEFRRVLIAGAGQKVASELADVQRRRVPILAQCGVGEFDRRTQFGADVARQPDVAAGLAGRVEQTGEGINTRDRVQQRAATVAGSAAHLALGRLGQLGELGLEPVALALVGGLLRLVGLLRVQDHFDVLLLPLGHLLGALGDSRHLAAELSVLGGLGLDLEVLPFALEPAVDLVEEVVDLDVFF